ncbi:hypothetical protein Csa_022153 [Cucumis sativus]|uniref:Uncharacterized protein n=1 Tax=Cucumis sativus TaxID=3659 RepID=A0A0A0LTB4_CUCSA|nr:hypothetical protein Csa_022153 [Cucumis sativus]
MDSCVWMNGFIWWITSVEWEKANCRQSSSEFGGFNVGLSNGSLGSSFGQNGLGKVKVEGGHSTEDIVVWGLS